MEGLLASIAKHRGAGKFDSFWSLVRDLSGRKQCNKGATMMHAADGSILVRRAKMLEACECKFLSEFNMSSAIADDNQRPESVKFLPFVP